jgi:hypothetical protein
MGWKNAFKPFFRKLEGRGHLGDTDVGRKRGYNES